MMNGDPNLGTGFVLLDLIMVALLTISAIINIAVLQDKHIHETPIMAAGRRIVIAGLCILAVRFWYVITQTGDLSISLPSLLGISLVALGSGVIASERFWQRWRPAKYAGVERRKTDRRKADRRSGDRRCDEGDTK